MTAGVGAPCGDFPPLRGRSAVPRDLLPCALPYVGDECIADGRVLHVSRSVRSRIRKKMGWRGWLNSAVGTLNELAGHSFEGDPSQKISLGQKLCLDEMVDVFRGLESPPCMTAAAACDELCGRASVYSDAAEGKAKYKRELLSLPPAGISFAKAEELLTGSDFEAWTDWRRVILRSPSEAREALTKVGDVRPYCDKALISKPREYAKFIGALHERGLISLAAEQPPTVGVFTVPKKMALNV